MVYFLDMSDSRLEFPILRCEEQLVLDYFVQVQGRVLVFFFHAGGTASLAEESSFSIVCSSAFLFR